MLIKKIKTGESVVISGNVTIYNREKKSIELAFDCNSEVDIAFKKKQDVVSTNSFS